jgi:hypothetical protein
LRRWSQEAIDRRLGHEDGPSPEELYLDGLEMDRRRLEERDRLYPPCPDCGWRHAPAACSRPLPAGDSGDQSLRRQVMASKAGVTLRGRFSPGTTVELVEVKDGSVLRSEGASVIDRKQVDREGVVGFTVGVTVGGYYFIRGQQGGFPLEVRVRGKADADDSAGFQAPIVPERQRLTDGSFLDDPPVGSDPGFAGVGPAPATHQARGVQLRSATPRGYAHPVGKDERAPYPAQEDVKKGVQQRSDTPTGQATPIAHQAPNSQADVKAGTQQRSATPLGYATPIPDGDAVDAQRERESADSKASVGEPGKVAANPPSVPLKVKDADRDATVVLGRESPLPAPPVPGDRDDVSGLDPMGQPAYADVAKAAGVDPADKKKS